MSSPSVPTLAGITSKRVETSRLKQHVLLSGPDDGEAVVFIHGNASSATFWEETMLALPPTYRGIAVDLRGYGDTEDERIDARRGLKDWADDVLALLQTLRVSSHHLVGHSLGGMLLYTLAPLSGLAVKSLTLVAPGSPWGFGGTKDAQGTPCWPDFDGSGGGLVNPEFARLMGEKNRGSDNPQASPRVVMNSFYWKPPFQPAREEDLLSSLLTERVGPDRYPGDGAPSANWPGMGPGVHGPLNAASPKYVGDSVERFWSAAHKPPVLWVRGQDDQIVGDASLFDMGTLGQLGAVPGWPGAEVFPPQPMVQQTRYALERYQQNGGRFTEVVLEECGHTPYIEKPEAFRAALLQHLRGA
jgi:pimeloyl-ACP methyl ester carboxylesterase